MNKVPSTRLDRKFLIKPSRTWHYTQQSYELVRGTQARYQIEVPGYFNRHEDSSITWQDITARSTKCLGTRHQGPDIRLGALHGRRFST